MTPREIKENFSKESIRIAIDILERQGKEVKEK